MSTAWSAAASAQTDIRVQVVAGDPLVDRATEIYREMLTAAGVDRAEAAQPPQERPAGRTSFHVAVDATGTALGVVHATFGSLEQLDIASLIDVEEHLPGPICECPSIAVLPEAAGRGVTELLYRSVYCFARRQGANSLAAMVDPLTLELFREDYGIMFRALGPVTSHLGFETLVAGGEISILEAELRRLRPDFFEFLVEPLSASELARFGL